MRGVKVVEHDDGRFEVSATSNKAKKELAHMLDGPRKLITERGQQVGQRRELVMVRNGAGKLVEINADSEAGAGQAGLIHSPVKTFGGRAPRCWDLGHDYRGESGRCWYCGRQRAS